MPVWATAWAVGTVGIVAGLRKKKCQQTDQLWWRHGGCRNRFVSVCGRLRPLLIFDHLRWHKSGLCLSSSWPLFHRVNTSKNKKHGNECGIVRVTLEPDCLGQGEGLGSVFEMFNSTSMQLVCHYTGSLTLSRCCSRSIPRTLDCFFLFFCLVVCFCASHVYVIVGRAFFLRGKGGL